MFLTIGGTRYLILRKSPVSMVLVFSPTSGNLDLNNFFSVFSLSIYDIGYG